MLRSGEPPPFTIDLIDETTHGSNAEIEWLGVKNDKVLYTIKTSAEYRKQDNTFNMGGYVATKPKGPNNEDQMVHHKLDGDDKTEQELHMETSQFVTREGESRAVWAKVEYFMRIDKSTGLYVKIDLELKRTKIVEGRFTPHWRGTITLYQPNSATPRSVDLVGKEVIWSPQANKLHNPLLPVNRLTGLEPGRRWRVQVADPIKDAVASALPAVLTGLTPEQRFLDATVLAETGELEWKSKLVTCHVVEFSDGEQLAGRIWARASDGLVLRQESYLESDAPTKDAYRDHWDIIRKTN